MDILESLLPQQRLVWFNEARQGCQHLWSKGQMQTEKIIPLLQKLYSITRRDPYFLASLTSWCLKQDSKDWKVINVFLNANSDADGLPILPQSDVLKPNLRQVAAAALQQLDPLLVNRIVQLAKMKLQFNGQLAISHFPVSLRTAVRKYLRYREHNLQILEGCVKAGLRQLMITLYRQTHTRPSDDAARILKWPQKDREIIFDPRSVLTFAGLKTREIADRIRQSHIAVPVAISLLGQEQIRITPVIGLALLEICSPKQAVVYESLFADNGLFAHPEILKQFQEKTAQAQSSVDRLKTAKGSAAVQAAKQQAVAQSHQQAIGNVGKVFVMLDISGSLGEAIDWAKKYAARIAEAIGEPDQNLRIGIFNLQGTVLNNPTGYSQADYAKLFYGIASGGGTDCTALYPRAREFGANIDVLVTDQRHFDRTDSNAGEEMYHLCLSKFKTKPQACLIVNIGDFVSHGPVYQAYSKLGLPVTEINGQNLEASTGIGEALRLALRGPLAIIDEIMATPLLELPKWYWEIN